MMVDTEEAMADAARLAMFLNALQHKYGEHLKLLADDPYCEWGLAGFLPKPPTGKPRQVDEAFEVCVTEINGVWTVKT
jgi:hypothetical protein